MHFRNNFGVPGAVVLAPNSLTSPQADQTPPVALSPVRLMAGMSQIILLVFLMLLSGVSLWADNFGVTVNASGSFCTNGIFGCTPGDTNYPSSNESKSATGLASASAMVSDSGTTSDLTNPAGTTSSYFSSVSATEGHIGLSFDGSAAGIGNAIGFGNANWNDIMTVGGVPLGTPVTLLARVGISAEFVGLGYGSSSVQACFSSGLFNICSSGSDSPLTLPVTVTERFTAFGGDTIQLSGEAGGLAAADNWGNALYNGADIYTSSSDWSMVATNSAHFTVTSPDPGVTLTLASGCSITNGYGCDKPPAAAPEPGSIALLGTGIGLIAMRLRGFRRTAASAVK